MPDARPRRLTPRVAAMLGSAGVLARRAEWVRRSSRGELDPAPRQRLRLPPRSSRRMRRRSRRRRRRIGRILPRSARITSRTAVAGRIAVRDVASDSTSSRSLSLFATSRRAVVTSRGSTTLDSFRLVERGRSGGSRYVTTTCASDVSGRTRDRRLRVVMSRPPNVTIDRRFRLQFVSAMKVAAEQLVVDQRIHGRATILLSAGVVVGIAGLERRGDTRSPATAATRSAG